MRDLCQVLQLSKDSVGDKDMDVMSFIKFGRKRILPQSIMRKIASICTVPLFSQVESINVLKKVKKSNCTLVIAPHPDDEVIGCGGTILKSRSKNVVCVYLTKGERSKGIETGGMENLRIKEAKVVGNLLGLKNQIFFENNQDGNLIDDDHNVREVCRILREFKPHLIFVPFFGDDNKDHYMASKIAMKALAIYGKPCWVCGYEVWSLLYPNSFVDITDVMDLKNKVIQEYETGLKVVNYVRTTSGLNAYRSIYAAGVGFFEAFLCLPFDHYYNLFNSFLMITQKMRENPS